MAYEKPDLTRAFKTALAMRGRTATELADAIERNRKTLYSAFYNGNPRISTVNRVAEELGFSTGEFIALGE